jgi:hypothetical protein
VGCSDRGIPSYLPLRDLRAIVLDYLRGVASWLIKRVKDLSGNVPVAVGFGISTREHFLSVTSIADGAAATEASRATFRCVICEQ